MTRSVRRLRTPAGAARDRRRKLSTGILLLLGLFAGLIGFAPIASAHHPQMTATAACSPTPGTYIITVDAIAWSNPSEPDRMVHEDIDLYWGPTSVNWPAVAATPPIPAGASAAVVYERDGAAVNPTDDGGQFLESNDYRFTAKFLVTTADPTIEVIAHADGPWGANQSYAGNEWRGVLDSSPGAGNGVAGTVTLPTGCVPGATPSAQAQLVCAENKINVNLTGVGSATTVDISKNGTLVGNDIPVPVGPSTYTLTLNPGDENTTVDLELDYAAATATDQSLTVPVDCKTPAGPSATISWACGSNVTVALGNSGQETIEATILKNGVPVFTNIDVPPGGLNKIVPVTGGDENTTMTIKVTFSDAGTGTDVTKAFTVDCNTPAPTIGTPVCAEGGLNITLGNVQGTDTATFTIVINGSETSQTVSAGATKVVLIPVAEDATVSVSITSGDQSYVNQSLKRDCQKPGASLSFSCAEGGVVVQLTNTGSEPTVINVNGTPQQVGANGTKNVTIPVAEGASYSVTVTGGDGLNKSISGTRDCEKPAATLSFSCAEGGVVVTLINTGVLPTSVLVNGNPVNVPAGGAPVVVKVPVAEGAAYSVTVTGGDGLNKTLTGTRDCEKPVASVVFDCAEGGVLVSLTNGGDLPALVDVNGESVNVPAGTTAENPVTRTIAVAEGATYNITVLGQTASGTRDCEKPAATLTFTCAEGGVVVTLTNGGELPTDVLVNGVQVTIPAGGQVNQTIPVAEGATYSVTVTGGDGLNESVSGTRNCEEPVVKSISLECAEGGVVVVLGNDGELDATVQVNGEDVTIPAGGQKTVTVPVAEGASYSVTVTGGDGLSESLAGTRNCEEPAVKSISLECAEGGVVVVLINDGELDATVKVNGEDVTIPAGGEKTVTIPVAENASYDFDIVIDGVTTNVAGTRDCEQPAIGAANLECAVGGVVVELFNEGLVDTIVLVDGVAVTVPAGTGSDNPVKVTVPVDENADYDFTVVGDGLEQSFTGTANCLLPEPSVDDQIVCAKGGLNIVLRNTGDDTATFTITSPALPGGTDEATVEAGSSVSVLIPLAEDASTAVKVTSGDGVLYDNDNLVRNCETVGGKTVTPGSTSLPRTGSNTTGLLSLAGALLLAGTALVTGARRRTPQLLS